MCAEIIVFLVMVVLLFLVKVLALELCVGAIC